MSEHEVKVGSNASPPGGRGPFGVRPAAPAEPKEWTIGGLLDWTAGFLAKKGSEFPRLDTEVLLAHSLGCRKIDLYVRFTEPAPMEARERFRDLVRRRVEGCPVAYLVGRKEFYSLEFEVGPAVLIPRPDTELLVMECLRLAKPLLDPRILDIGTGSGNIPVAVARYHPRAQLTAVDVSPDALALAARNAARHGVQHRIRFLPGDLFEPLQAGERFDFVLSNPPYIASEDLPRLPPGVRDFEPHLALDGGPGGFAFLDRLLDRAADHLEPGGYLLLEIGAPQAGPIREHVATRAALDLEETLQDSSGHPRVLRIRRRA